MDPTDPSVAALALRITVGAAGGLALLFGARLYKPTLFAGAFGAGAIGVTVAVSYLPLGTLDTTAVAITAAVAGMVAAVVAGLAHKAALVGVGGVVGVVVGAAAASALLLPFWVPLVGAAVGALVFPLAFKPLLKLLTPAVGAPLVAWAAGVPERIEVIVGLYLVGVLAQVFFLGKARKKAKDDA